MLFAKDLRNWSEEGLPNKIRFKQRLTLEQIVSELSNEESGLPTIGIQTEFVSDQIQSGNLFNKQYEDCIVLKNCDHEDDYFHFVFTVRRTGNSSTISVFRSGVSPLSAQYNKKELRKNDSSLFKNILGALTSVDNQALDAEYDYYALVIDIIKDCFNI